MLLKFIVLKIVCRNCSLNRARAYRAKEKEERNTERIALVKDSKMRSRYGIGLNDFNAATIAQDSKCAICQKGGRKLFIDHSHEDKKVRALLCNICNTGFGLLAENIQYMDNAKQYLMFHGNT